MRKFALLSLLSVALISCSGQPSQISEKTAIKTPQTVKVSEAKTPDWAKDAVIYQINTRQYSEAGTFKAVEDDLARIKALGVDILWFMPIHPIGEEKRKGSMGSPYAVKDFQAVNPELGTLENFKSLVDAAQALGMKVIIDWVANHTAWDNHLVTDHPDWYTRDANGKMQHPPETDWLDVVDLDYTHQGVRDYMVKSLTYWIRDIGIDGFRCDVAGMVPTDFWNDARSELNKIKPVFMLAEWQEPKLHVSAFDASYAWRWKEIMQDIVKGQANAQDMVGYYLDYQTKWPKGSMRMAYTSNHDQNTWDGLPQDIYGDAYEAGMVLSFVGEGIPLIYNGQESGNSKGLEFFEKDLIVWDETHPNNQMFKRLVMFKTKNEALHNGRWGASKHIIKNDNPKAVLSFMREQNGNRVLAIFNLTPSHQAVTLKNETINGEYTRFNNNQSETVKSGEVISLEPWAYRILTQQD